MKLKNAEHLTRYTVFFEGHDYIRLHEKSVDGTINVNWMIIEEGTVYFIGDEKSEILEKEFEKIVQ